MQPTVFLRLGATIALALACTAAPAQKSTTTKPAQPAVKAKGSDAIMTRDELRACMKRQEEIEVRNAAATRERTALDAERAEVRAFEATLGAERDKVKEHEAAVRAVQAKMKAHGAAVEAWNERNAKVADMSRRDAERAQAELKDEREALVEKAKAIEAERDRTVPPYEAAVKAFNDKIGQRDARVADWNQRNARTNTTADAVQADRDAWVAECGNRRFREEDEKAIKAGK